MNKQKQKIQKTPQFIIYEAYQNLNQAIDEMDIKVESVIRRHEAQFLFAYRNHIQKIKQQLAEIKQKSEEQEKKLSSNDRALYFQKQMAIFREQALKLYDKVTEKTQQNQLYQSRILDLEQSLVKAQKNSKDMIKQLKSLNAKNKHIQAQIRQLSEELIIKNTHLEKNQNKINYDLDKTKNHTQNIQEIMRRTQLQKNEKIVSKIYCPSQQIFNNFKRKNQAGRANSIRQKNRSFNVSHLHVQDSQLKEWFLTCICTIRKQIAQRRNDPIDNIDLQGISGIQQFKMIDKLRLLEIFLQNEKLMVWMYEKIFPNRMCEIKAYLKGDLNKNIKHIQNKTIQEIQELINSTNPRENDKQFQEEKQFFPKMVSKKKNSVFKQNIKNKISLKAGKLNIANVND